MYLPNQRHTEFAQLQQVSSRVDTVFKPFRVDATSTLPTHVEGIDLRLVVPFEPTPSLIKRTESGNRETTLNRENVIRLCGNAKTTRRYADVNRQKSGYILVDVGCSTYTEQFNLKLKIITI